MTTILELVARIEGGKEKTAEVVAVIEAAKELGNDLSFLLRTAQAERTAEVVDESITELAEVVELLAGVSQSLEKARHLAEATVNHTGLGPLRAVAEPVIDNKDGEAGKLPQSGDELVAESESKVRGIRGLVKRAVKEDATDPAKNITESVDNFSRFFRDTEPPETVATTQVPQPPVFDAPAPPKVGASSAAVAVMALAVISAKGAESFVQLLRRMSTKWRDRE